MDEKELCDRIKTLSDRLLGAPEYVQERSQAVGDALGPDLQARCRLAYQVGALEHICLSVGRALEIIAQHARQSAHEQQEHEGE